MTFQTQVIWNLPLGQSVKDQTTEKSNELIAEGREIGEAVYSEEGDQEIVTRVWIDQITALEWIAFVEQFDPVSATIIN
jgi:hypothetical protein